MSTNDPNYTIALENSGTYLTPPEGLSNFDPVATQDRVMIKQNNTIIELLILLGKKLDLLMEYAPKHIPDIAHEIDALTQQMANWKPIELKGTSQQLNNTQYNFGTPRK